jgi:hypothetical protein
MTRITILRLTAAAAAGVAILFVSEKLSPTDPATLVTSADARIGRPLTPMSYAGVARRTARRGAYVGAAAGAAAGAYYGSGCYQTADAYGRVYTQCP